MSTRIVRAVRLAACGAALGLAAPAFGAPIPRPARFTSDDVTVYASVDSIRVLEGNEGQRAAVFTVRLSAPAGVGPRFLSYSTHGVTAEAGSDFEMTTGTLSLNSTDLAYSIAVNVFGDSIVEGNERFELRLSDPSPGIGLAQPVGLGVIVNDERPRFRRTLAGLTPYYIGNLPPAFGYADDDLLPDLPLNRNVGAGNFAHHSGMAAAMIWGNHHGTAWCDYDRDGRSDLVITPYAEGDPASKLQLLRNLGGGAFEDVAPALGMDVVGRAETPVWGDFDGDGWPDLFVPFYSDLPPWQSFLWRNNQDGTFTEISAQAGVDMRDIPPAFRPEGADAVDWNGDGSLDLYCAQRLFLNDGYGRFTDVRAQTGLPAYFDEGSKFVDVDNDGDFDLFLRTWSGPLLFRNDKEQYVDVGAEAGIPFRPLYWGDSWADVDNDGDLDLMLMHPVSAELYLNQGDGTFVSDSSFLALDLVSSLSAWADVDLDGDLDAAIGASVREMLINRTEELPGAREATLRVWVLDADGRKSCPGAIVRLHEIGGGPGTIQTRVVDGGSGYLTQGEYPVHFGGLGIGRYWLEVRYPGSVHTATIVDGRNHPVLEDFNPAEEGMGTLFVYRNGRIEWQAGSPGSKPAFPMPNRAPAALGPAWPQPARDRLAVTARLEGVRADLHVHDVTGRRIRTLARDLEATGTRRIEWDLLDEAGGAVPSGIYFLRLAVGGRFEGERRVVVLR